MADAELKVVTHFEGLPPDFDRRVYEYIEASYPDRFVPKRAIDTIAGLGYVGGAFAAVAAVDILQTRYNNMQNPLDSQRDSAESDMGEVMRSISASLEVEPDETHVCTLDDGYGGCETTQVYEVRTEEGVLRFVTDSLNIAGLSEQQTVALTDSLPTEANGARTEEFDAEIISGLESATEAYVASIPDAPQQTTNASSGEILFGGSVVLLAGLATSKLLRKRLERQANRAENAQDRLRFATAGFTNVNRTLERHVKKSVGFVGGRAHSGWVLKGPSDPARGGRKARAAMGNKVNAAIQEAEQSQQQVS